MKFSANLGFLWSDLALPDAIRAAKRVGFDAVECHWPYCFDPLEVKAALVETELTMISLNTTRGNVALGENGLSALPERQEEARKAICESLDYAAAVDARAVHVMAGTTNGEAALKTFIENLSYASVEAEKFGLDVLIEPLNNYDAPNYFLNNTAQACEIIEEVSASNLKLMFDCYHAGRTEGDVVSVLKRVYPVVGHIQVASVSDRGTPDRGDVDYAQVFSVLTELGWDAPIGAEYGPKGETEASLGWFVDRRWMRQ